MILFQGDLLQMPMRPGSRAWTWVRLTVRQLVVKEMNHRVKNTLAVVEAMATQTFRKAPVEHAVAFHSRLRALGQAHDLITHGGPTGITLPRLIQLCLAPYHPDGDRRLVLRGPEIELSETMAVNVALAANELATNATKYGALSTEEGVVEIAWTICEPGILRFAWMERGGPPVSPPSRKGFGSRLIEGGFGHRRGSSVEVNYAASGFSCLILAPLA